MIILVTFILSSANTFNLNEAKISQFGKELGKQDITNLP